MNKQERWERDLPELIVSIFPPRICKDLSNLTIEIQPDDIQTITIDQQGLFIHGNSGTGKTLYACALLLESIRYYSENRLGRPSVTFVTSLGLLEQIKRTFNDDQNNPEEDLLQMYSEVNLLILDDVGAEKVSAWVLQTLNYIINARYEYLRPTIITSNFDLNVLQDLLDGRLVSRMYAMTKQKHFIGQNYRLEKEG